MVTAGNRRRFSTALVVLAVVAFALHVPAYAIVARFGEEKLDVVAESEFIASGTPVRVTLKETPSSPVIALDAGITLFDAAHQPAEQPVLPIRREDVRDDRAAACAEREPGDVAIVAQHLIEVLSQPFTVGGTQKSFLVEGGFLQVENDIVTVLSEQASAG